MMRFNSRSKQETCLNPVYPMRRCVCPHCETTFEAARRAVTLKCPNCAKPIQFQDIVFTRSSAETLTTLGRVHITRRGSVQGSINCSELLIEGMMNGTLTVRGRAVISNKANVTGTLRTGSLMIESGGRLRGRVEIAPHATANSEQEPV